MEKSLEPRQRAFAAERGLGAAHAAADLQNLGLAIASRRIQKIRIEAHRQCVGRKILQPEAHCALGAELAFEHEGTDH